MIVRLWFLVLLVLVGAFAPSRAGARAAETRTWVFLPTVTETRLESEPQVADTHQENGLWNYEHAPGCTRAAERTVITSGNQVTEATIRAAMKDAPLVSQQAGGVSLPKVQNYVQRLLSGETPPAIKVDGGMIVDGNHRYIAGRILGQETPTVPWAGGRPERAVPWDQLKIDPNPWD